jgi:NAD(P)-dependent dehydrogenase (short-subunit alcohol dehydrogenase family)
VLLHAYLGSNGRPGMSSYFQGKVAVVTGAGSGIGRALAVKLAARGARLALSDIDEAALAVTANMCGSPDVRCYRLNVADRDAVLAHAADVERDFGAAHHIFNNAGATLVGTFEHSSIEEIEWQLNVNLLSVVYGSKAFLPIMLRQREGCIVNISSIFGLISYPTQSAYNISKFGVRGLTECLWSELEGTGVRAVCVHPGGIRTNIERAGRRVKLANHVEADFARQAEKMLVTPPEECAEDILRGIVSGKRRILTGHFSRVVHFISRWFPNSYPSLLKFMG